MMISDEDMVIGLYERLVILEDEREAAYAQVRRLHVLDERSRLIHDLMNRISPRPWPQ